jgi:hypothetical protein
MAVGRGGEFGQHFPPPVAIGGPTHGQFERGFATRPAPDCGPAKQPPAQRVQFAFLQLSQSPLEQHAKVVSGNGQMVQGFRAPEVFHAQPLDAKLPAQFLDPVFQVRPAVVATPHRQRVDARWQVGDQGLNRYPASSSNVLPPACGRSLTRCRITIKRRPGRASSTSCTATPGTSVICHAASS